MNLFADTHLLQYKFLFLQLVCMSGSNSSRVHVCLAPGSDTAEQGDREAAEHSSHSKHDGGRREETGFFFHCS